MLFEQFLKENCYLQGVSDNTIDFYKAFLRFTDGTPTKANTSKFVIDARESGMKVATINAYIRGLNSYFTWLHANDQIETPLAIKKIKEEQRIIQTYRDEDIRTIISFKGENLTEKRLHTGVPPMSKMVGAVKRQVWIT